jgi:flavin-dependent dehydrogenase
LTKTARSKPRSVEMSSRKDYDVAIIGGGPAGCAAAITLARAGVAVVLFERSHFELARVGECVPPEICEPLQELDLWAAFETDGHLAVNGITSYWGAPQRCDTDFISNAYGQGWAVDRRRFDAMLAAGAAAAGANVRLGNRVTFYQRDSHGWLISVVGQDKFHTLHASFIVNAMGRRGALPLLPTRRSVRDRLVAAVRYASASAAQTSGHRLLIETCEHGWWYSAFLPTERIVSVFFTDVDLIAGPRRRQEDFWSLALRSAAQTERRLRVAGAAEPLRIVPASPSRARFLVGPRWLSIGDAAVSHDPLCGQGIYLALRSGIEAAKILRRVPETQTQLMRHHTAKVLIAFRNSVRIAASYYRMERRWPQAAFWRRRR